uniref:Class I SAM-dependent methyltransferase n=1 Tax=Roseihalotalea indica TaxID=2867963 RepID=A0AA49GTJ1_9BACT|nr:class I SAM-dependent methyltransferase [Tunicatimonas sp. TK19036]
MISAPDVYGQALSDYFYESSYETLWVHTSYGTREEMPVDWFFREPDEFPEVEQYALSLCQGKVLDIGAGVGVHVLALQEQGFDVLALEQSELCSNIMHDCGVRQVLTMPYQNYHGPRVDTILLLMNGIGLVGNIPGLQEFLGWAKHHIQPEGQLLFDSSDVAYLFDDTPIPTDYYYGEIQFQYEYREKYGDWFSWLYVDFNTLVQVAQQEGWEVQQIFEDETQQYLVRLTLSDSR